MSSDLDQTSMNSSRQDQDGKCVFFFENDRRPRPNVLLGIRNMTSHNNKCCSMPNVSVVKNKHLLKRHLQEFPLSVEQTLSNQEFANPNTKHECKNIEEFIEDLRNMSPECEESRVPLFPVATTPDFALTCDPSPTYCENQRLIENPSSFADIKWSEVNTAVSPGSTIPESQFVGSKNRNRKSTKFPERAVLKTGECNVLHKNKIGKSRLRYIQDIFTTLVDVQWRWTLITFSLSFIGSWLFYGGLYWLIAYAHGDFEHLGEDGWTPCVENLNGFTSAFLFSLETQHTIGYGGRSTNEECPEAIFIMCIQSITGVMISAFMAGIFFAKMARPKQRRQTLLFSRRAVICQRDGLLCLMFRVGDMRKSHIIGTNIRAHFFHTRTTREGEELRQYQGELTVKADGCESGLLFLWPLTIVHVIDKDSPLFNISAQELIYEKFEIVAVLEGTVESTGQTTQARSSYIPSEIKWGHRFEPIVKYNDDRQGYEIDYKKFNNTMKVATPLCSARDLEELFMIHSELLDYNVTATPETV